MMKALKLSLDLTDQVELVELLRMEAARGRKSQKAIVVEALKAYFAEKLESALAYTAADRVFAEWHNEDDAVYDNI